MGRQNHGGADHIFCTPILGAALIGHYFGPALGITVYWPIPCLWTVRAALGTRGWYLSMEGQYMGGSSNYHSPEALGLIILALGVW